MSLTQSQVSEYRRLRDTGIQVEKGNNIRFNSGSETAIHCVCKMLVGRIGIEWGYRVDSEVPIVAYDGAEYETDILLWGHDDRTTLCVELEHSPTQQVKREKIDRYVADTAIQDMLMVNLNDSPHDIVDCYGWLGSELGLPVE